MATGVLGCKLQLLVLCLISCAVVYCPANAATLGVEFGLLQRACPTTEVAASSWSAQSHLVSCLSLCAAATDTSGSSETACAAAHFQESNGRCGLLDSSQLSSLLAGKSAARLDATGCPGRQTWLVLVNREETTTEAWTIVTTTAAAATTAKGPSFTDLSGATYLGCYADDGSSRVLSKDSKTSDSMTRSMCMSYCRSGRYSYFGLKNYTECYCDKNCNTYNVKLESECSLPCKGNSTEICGGPLTISVYKSNWRDD